MAIKIPERVADLVTREKRAFAYLALVKADGTPQVTPIWFDYDGTHFIFNTARGRLKDRILRKHPTVAFVIDDVTESEAFMAAAKGAMRGKLVVAGLGLHDLASTVGLLHTYWRRHYFLPTTLKGIVSCKGVLVLCPACREPKP